MCFLSVCGLANFNETKYFFMSVKAAGHKSFFHSFVIFQDSLVNLF